MAEDTMPDDAPVAPWDWPRACPYPRRGDLEAAFAEAASLTGEPS